MRRPHEYLHLLLDTPGARAWYTSRGAADPLDPYDGFNVCNYTGDTHAHINECREALATALGTPGTPPAIPRQTHSARTVTITAPGRASQLNDATALPVAPKAIEGCDALVTDLRRLVIGVNTADCVPLVMADDCAGVCAAVHAGWRGALGGIVQSALESMRQLGASPERIHAAIGPAICVECFEVGTDVAHLFEAEGRRLGHITDGRLPDFVEWRQWPKPHVNLPAYVTALILENGILPANIQPYDASRCTRHHPGTYFSARALGTASGRVFTCIRLN